MSNVNELNQETEIVEEKLPFADKAKIYKSNLLAWGKNKADGIENKFLKVLFIIYYHIVAIFQTIGLEIAIFSIDFVDSIKRNPSKGGGLLIATPGILIGFLLVFQIDCVYELGDITSAYFALFALVMAGAINIFSASNVIKKRSLGASIMATIVTAIIVGCGILYLSQVFHGMSWNKEKGFSVTYSTYVSIVTVILSMLLSTAGVVISYIFYDHTYQRDKG